MKLRNVNNQVRFKECPVEGMVFHHMYGREELGKPYSYQVTVFSDEGDLRAADILGKSMSIELDIGEDSLRPYRMLEAPEPPTVHGPQPATVVGKEGEEIWTDEYGRVKIQFHWDRDGKRDENSSCWVRVAQIWAGSNFGGINIPRIGEEVIVDFLEGDPDRPIITGRVYNAANMPGIGRS